MARARGIALHAALDAIARTQGFTSWSLLSARARRRGDALSLDALAEGDTVLLAARPGQGKTVAALELLLEAARAGREAMLFTLVMSHADATTMLAKVAGENPSAGVGIETSDEIDADLIIARLDQAPPGTVAVIDYLQMLDERRTKPALGEQVERLASFARDRGIVIVFLSQVDRAFDAPRQLVPRLSDVRAPNPFPVSAFSKGLFLHGGTTRIETLR